MVNYVKEGIKKYNEKIKCYCCGAIVDKIDGKPHKYIGAIQGCWNLYCEI
jgi:hypothetical protein